MGKKNKSSQFPKKDKSSTSVASTLPTQPKSSVSPIAPVSPPSVKPEGMSLLAYKHIQECLKYTKYKDQTKLTKEDVTAILRLAQHLRVFGLLSAVGYLNQAKEGKVQDRTQPMWLPLLWQLVYLDKPLGKPKELMQAVQQMATNEPRLYMVTWRKALVFSNHWNFWAKAHQDDTQNGNPSNGSTEHSSSIG